MATVPPHELLALLARIAFVLLLYLLVLVILFSLGRRLITPPPQAAPDTTSGPPDQRDGANSEVEAGATLMLIEASRTDGPPGRLVSVDRSVVIGRHPECDVVLRDGSVSGRHARIALTRDGFRVEDLGSTNGTFVNGQRITRPATVRPGDTIQTGNATWRLDS